MGMKTLELSVSLMICLQIEKKSSVAYCSMKMKMFFVLKTVSAAQLTSAVQPVSAVAAAAAAAVAAQQASAVAHSVVQTVV